MGVAPTSYTLEVGLQPNGSFRELLINEDHIRGVWPLSELAATRARDIGGLHHDGTYTGQTTGGFTVPLPEGALGTAFAGSGYVVVPNHEHLSLSAGSMDIIFLMRTSTNDATDRPIVIKHDGTNGYIVSLINGTIRFFLASGGATVFTFDRGAVADDAWHLVHCCYEPEDNRCRIFIDGVQSGAADNGTTEPQITTADLHIAGTGAGNKFIGYLAFVMIGREGNPDLSVALQAVRSWTSLNADTQAAVEALRWRKGIPGSSILDNTARPGFLSFALNNSAKNSATTQGYYSPGHASVRSGWQIGIPVRFSVTYGGTTYYKFRGHVTSVKPLPGQSRGQDVSVTCSDWMDIAGRVFVSALEAQVAQRSDHVLEMVLDQTEGRSPAAVSIGIGSSTFAYALDAAQGEQESILTELARVTNSERGFCYQRGDTVQGGTFVWEGRGDRQTQVTLETTLSNTMHGLEVEYSLDRLVNIVRVVVTPRRVDSAATTVLYRLESSQQAQPIAPGETVVLEGGYRDPDEKAVRVGGTAMVTPVANTDYAFWSDSGGVGTNLNSSLTVVSQLGGNSFRVELTNAGSQIGYLRLNSTTAFQIRGKGMYHYTPATVERRDETSVRRHGPRTVQIDLAYESDRAVAESVADFVLGIMSSQRPIPTSVYILANDSDALMTAALAREPGDKIGLVETMTAVKTDDPDADTDIGYYINQEEGTYAPGGIITMTWTLAPSAPTGAGVFDVSAFDEDFVFGY